MNSNLIPVPVALLGGFLGAGKTTLLNRILHGDHGLKITVLVNDFGAIDIDSQLLASQSANSISLKNGCICCNLQNDMVGELQGLLRQAGGPPEFLLIESSGVSDPSKILHALRYPKIRQQFHINTVLTLIDAATINDLEGEVKHLAMAQLDAADIIVLNKTDCVDQATIDSIYQRWLYPAARVIETTYADIPPQLLFADQGHSEQPQLGFAPVPQDHSGLFHTFSWRSERPLQLDRLRCLMQQLPKHIMRAKGVFYTSQLAHERVILQAVGSRVEWSKDSQLGPQPVSEVVMIAYARDIDRPKGWCWFNMLKTSAPW